jgi:hypothetical protein
MNRPIGIPNTALIGVGSAPPPVVRALAVIIRQETKVTWVVHIRFGVLRTDGHYHELVIFSYSGESRGVGNGDGEIIQAVNHWINRAEAGGGTDVRVVAIAIEVQKAAGNISISKEHGVMAIATIIGQVTEIVPNEQTIQHARIRYAA